MAKVGAQRAAELTGRSKSTIQRAMDGGKLSFELAENGRRVIDVSELERVFGLGGPAAANDRKKPSAGMANVAELERAQLRAKSLEDQMFLLNQQVDDLKGQRDSWQKQAQQLAITHQTTQDQASSFKTQAEEYKAKIDSAAKEAEDAKRAAENAQRDAEDAKKELENLKKIAAQMKARLQGGQRPSQGSNLNVKVAQKPKTLMELLGFGGSKAKA